MRRPRAGGGIGRRARLRALCPLGRGGSSPLQRMEDPGPSPGSSFDSVRRSLYASVEHTFAKRPVEARVLTDRQQQIWNYLVEYVDRHGYPPTVREIGEQVGLASPSTVHAHLANLERAGLLKRDPTKPRALELIGREREAEVSVPGSDAV